MLKRIMVLLMLVITVLGANNVSGYLILDAENEEEKIYELVDDLETEKRKNIWNFIRDYKKYNSKLIIEELKNKYKIGKVEKNNKNLYNNKKKEAYKKIKNISKEIAFLVEKQKEENNYEIKDKILSELDLEGYVPLKFRNSNISFYDQILSLEKDDLDFGDTLINKLNGYNIFIVKNIVENSKKNEFETMDYIEDNLKDFYNKKEFKKLNITKIEISELEKGIKIDFSKVFSNLKQRNSLFINLYIEYNGLYIKINGGDYVTLNNTDLGKLNFLEELFNNKNSSRKKEFELMLENSFPQNNKNYYLEEKIRNVLIKIENKIKNKEKFKDYLNKIQIKVENIDKNYEKEGLTIAGKINSNSDIDIILEEYKKYKYKAEVIKILLKQIDFKLKEPFYDLNINELTDFNNIK